MISLKDFTVKEISENNMFKKECYMMIEISKFIKQSELSAVKKKEMEEAIECSLGAMIYLDEIVNDDMK